MLIILKATMSNSGEKILLCGLVLLQGGMCIFALDQVKASGGVNLLSLSTIAIGSAMLSGWSIGQLLIK